MMVHKRVLLPPVPGAATVVVLDDGRVGFGTWGATARSGGIVGVDDDEIVSFRQNLDPLIDHGQVNPTGRNLWGFTLPGQGRADRALGPLRHRRAGTSLYAWGDDVSATTLAKAMKMGGCDYGMHLDMNPYHTGFLFTAIDDLAAQEVQVAAPHAGDVDPHRSLHPVRAEGLLLRARARPHAARGRRRGAVGGRRRIAASAALDAGRLDRARRRRRGRGRAPRRRGRARRVARPRRERRNRPAARRSASSRATTAGASSSPSARASRPRSARAGIATDGRLAVPVHGGDELGRHRHRRRRQARDRARRRTSPRSMRARDLVELPLAALGRQGLPAAPGAAAAARGHRHDARRPRARRARHLRRAPRPSPTRSRAPAARAPLALDRGAARDGLPRSRRHRQPAARPLRRVGPLRPRHAAAAARVPLRAGRDRSLQTAKSH